VNTYIVTKDGYIDYADCDLGEAARVACRRSAVYGGTYLIRKRLYPYSHMSSWEVWAVYRDGKLVHNA
jgi:RAB protein geranylgeranyltransferase component A